MRIGILSDTHSKLDRAKVALDTLIKDGAEYIIHAGDLIHVEMLEMLKNCGVDYIAVYGNNDAHLIKYHNSYNLVQEPSFFKLNDLKFKLMHLPFHMSPDADVVISGHTHIFESSYLNDTLFLNPGEVCAREKPISSFAILQVTDKKYIVEHYTIKTNSTTVDKKEYIYERK
ncbi:MAG: YfcE family phosphodiesterase [Campylobacterota bacterium]|nr:YfcE family phosphodiesterase [Campylobacterota bacterium]